jgi:integral membrane protein
MRTATKQGTSATRRALTRYRVLAYTTAVLLIVLVFVGIPLQLAAGKPEVVNVVGTMHGFLYIVYLVTAFDLTLRLRVPKWQMALVLLAGTVPFCAFIAERKMSRRYASLTGEEPVKKKPRPKGDKASFRGRWFSRRALLLHLEVAIVAPGCALAGWWQATRALSGNELSWVYSIEWPIFALIALGGWWQLVHEDPASYRARRAKSHESELAAMPGTAPVDYELAAPVDRLGARVASILSLFVAIDVILGLLSVVVIPIGRRSGWLPAKGKDLYLAHGLLGFLLVLAAVGTLSIIGRSGRTGRLAAWSGLVGLAIAGLGGLLTEPHSLIRFLGMALMFVGPSLAGLAYLIPSFSNARRRSGAGHNSSELPAGHPQVEDISS